MNSSFTLCICSFALSFLANPSKLPLLRQAGREKAELESTIQSEALITTPYTSSPLTTKVVSMPAKC